MNIELVERVVGLLTEYPVAEITLEQDGARVCVRRSAFVPLPAPPDAPAHAPIPPAASGASQTDAAAETETTEARAILLAAPMVGLFHHLPAPVRYGGAVAVGQVVGHIESMKLMNDVLAEEGGRIMEVLVEDGGAVEYGQPLFRLAP